MTQILAMSTGKPLVMIPDEIQQAAQRQLSANNMHRYALEHFSGSSTCSTRSSPTTANNLAGRPLLTPALSSPRGPLQ